MIRVEQVFVTASPAAVKLVDLPAGPAQVVLSAIASGAAVSYGPGTLANLTSTNGGLLNAGQSVTINIPPGAGPQVLNAVGIGGTAIVGTTISTPN